MDSYANSNAIIVVIIIVNVLFSNKEDPSIVRLFTFCPLCKMRKTDEKLGSD